MNLTNDKFQSPRRKANAASDSAEVSAEIESEVAAPARKRLKNPFGSMRQKLNYAQRPGYFRYWFNNDDKGRIATALEGGYTHVKDSGGDNIRKVVGVANGGGPLEAFLMEIPLEWWKEDQAAQQASIDKVEAALRRGVVPNVPVSAEDRKKMYIPGDEIGRPRMNISHEARRR
jgi:hypothetical protein